MFQNDKGATTGGLGGVRTLPKIWTDHPNFLDEECDYRYVTECSARNWVYHPYFVLYNNLDHGIGPPTLKMWLHPCTLKITSVTPVGYPSMCTPENPTTLIDVPVNSAGSPSTKALGDDQLSTGVDDDTRPAK